MFAFFIPAPLYRLFHRALCLAGNNEPVRVTPDSEDEIQAIKVINQDFLRGIDYKSPHTPPDLELREKITTEIVSWDLDLSPKLRSKLLESSFLLTEACYGHLDFNYRFYAGLYTCFFFYADDHCETNPDAVAQFAQRFIGGERQLDPVLDKFAAHIRLAFDLYPAVAANSIVASSLEFLNATYIENVTSISLTIHAHSGGITARYPWFLRSRSAVGVAFGHMAFPKSDSYGVHDYIQIIPELHHVVSWVNLSFYKEHLAGEQHSYIMTRAKAEQKPPIQVLRENSGEAIDTMHRVADISRQNEQISALASKFAYGYVEFHLVTPRYRLSEVGTFAD